MNYKIPNHIKLICKKENLSDPNDQEDVKKELKKFLETYLSLEKDKGNNSLANITDIVSENGEFPIKGSNYPFERDVAGRMMRTRNYTIQEGVNEAGKKEVYVIAADRDWWDKHKFLFTLLTLGAGTLIGIMSDPLKGFFHAKSNEHYLIKDTIQVRLQNSITPLYQRDTVYNLPIVRKVSKNNK